jgi:hypothetical protein
MVSGPEKVPQASVASGDRDGYHRLRPASSRTPIVQAFRALQVPALDGRNRDLDKPAVLVFARSVDSGTHLKDGSTG